jgi:hypothetical protein
VSYRGQNTEDWERDWYCCKYGLSRMQVAGIGVERLNAMTEIGQDIMCIITRLETRGRNSKPKRAAEKKPLFAWRKPVEKEVPEQIEKLIKLAGRRRA